jgi:DNA polymerase V
VAVLSNNDGCIIARSEELKAPGPGGEDPDRESPDGAEPVPMGAPYFKWKEDLEKRGTAVLSSNYALYGDMSSRVASILRDEALEL